MASVSPFVMARVKSSVIAVNAPPFLEYVPAAGSDPPTSSNRSVPVPEIVRVADVTGDDPLVVLNVPLKESNEAEPPFSTAVMA